MDNSNTTSSKAQLDEKISRELMAGMDGDLSNISQEAADVLASLDGALFQDDSGSILTSIGKPKATAAMPRQERMQLLAESQELFPQQEIVVPQIGSRPEEQVDALDALADALNAEEDLAQSMEQAFVEQLADDIAADDLLQEDPTGFAPIAPTQVAAADFADDGEEDEEKESFTAAIQSTSRLQRIFLGALCLVCIASFASLGLRRVKESRLLRSDTVFGVTMEGVDLEGMSAQEASTAIDEIRADKDTSQKLTLRAAGRSYSTTLDAFSPVYDTQGAFDLAWGVGRTGTRSQKLHDIALSRAVPQALSIPCSFDEAAVNDYVAQLADKIDRPVQDAALEFAPVELRESDYPFIETREQAGQTLNRDAAVQAIRDSATTGDHVIELDVAITEPTVFLADLKENVQPMRTFTTEYARISSRTFNIHRATDTINGTVLQPGDEFSFNRIVGNTSLASNGYREAGVIVGGRSATDRGGGVCQAATTLYNVAVRCDMEITARDPHAIASSYVPRGQDATIAYGHCDLAFINTSEYPVYIVGKYTDTSVTFTMYGRPLENGITIEMESEHLGTRSPGAAKVTEDPTKPVGYEQTVVSALNGYDIRVYKVWYDADGNEIRRVVDHTDAYPTRRAEIIVGTKPAPEPTPTPDPGAGGGGGTEPDPGAGGGTPDPGSGTEG